MGMNLCRGCDVTFGSLAAFETHRTGDFSRGERRCLTVDEIQALGMVQNTKGWWIRSIFNGMALGLHLMNPEMKKTRRLRKPSIALTTITDYCEGMIQCCWKKTQAWQHYRCPRN